jgi:O-antigen/teichoic acid export membrane protein
VLVASGIALLSSPITGAILPRLTKLNAQGDEAGVIRLYRDATQLVAVIAVPVVLVLAFFPLQVLSAWTGQPEVAAKAAPVLTLYAVGNGILALAAFPYYLQVARGNLNLHLIGNLIFVLLFVPLLLLSVTRFGMIGAGYAWILANLLPFLAWLPVVHHRFLKGLHLRWLTQDIGVIALPPTMAAALAAHLIDWPPARWALVALLIVLYIGLVLAAAGSSSTVRARLRGRSSIGMV